MKANTNHDHVILTCTCGSISLYTIFYRNYKAREKSKDIVKGLGGRETTSWILGSPAACSSSKDVVGFMLGEKQQMDIIWRNRWTSVQLSRSPQDCEC